MAQVTPRLDAENIYHALLEYPAQFPASFTYDGKQYQGFPAPDFVVADRTYTEKADRECNVLTLQGPKGLTVVIDTAFYPAFGVYEWTLLFANHGDADIGVLENLYA